MKLVDNPHDATVLPAYFRLTHHGFEDGSKVQLAADEKVLANVIKLARDLYELASWGDYSNGNVFSGVDEGRVKAWDRLESLGAILKQLEGE